MRTRLENSAKWVKINLANEHVANHALRRNAPPNLEGQKQMRKLNRLLRRLWISERCSIPSERKQNEMDTSLREDASTGDELSRKIG